MSGPFRFNQQSAQSPLERVASPFSAGGQPVSYKTNVNRAKTKKWVEAKKNAYDGDDWGDYDEYDEYGVDTTPPPEPAAPSNQRYYGQRPPYDTPSRSFTDPSQQLPLPKARRNSFDAGEEQRSFSAAVPHAQNQGYAQRQPQQPAYAQQPAYTQPPPLQTGGMGRDVTESSAQSPSMHQPLQTRTSPDPSNVYGSPVNTQFPPRKSSIGQGNAPPAPIDSIPVATSPRERTGSQDKPLPFIRPADIYKRVEEERRRESIESQSRPSLDSLSSRPKDEPTSPSTDRRNLQPLQTVAERKSEYLPDLDVTAQQQDNPPEPQRPQQQDRAPTALEGIPTFDNDFWSSGPDLQSPTSHASAVSPTQDQGLRSVVDQAFTRTDDQRSVPPTPISKDSDSDLNRSNTGSTSGISPIMSRVPSSATAALKNRGLGDGSTPVIAEEPHEAGTPVSRPTSSNLAQTTHATQGHARNVSSTSIPRSGLATPTRGDSPARSPDLRPHQPLPEPETAQIATNSPDSPGVMEGGLQGPQSAYATREADIAQAMLSSPVRAVPELGAAEKQSQDAFLDSHKAQSPISDALPRDRSESPSKGRVQALAGKFGEVSSSRRGSTQSNVSRNSVQSWEQSRNNSRTPSPSKGSPTKPSSPKKEFRPHLPGGWESYAITTPAPLDRRESEKGLTMESLQNSSAPTQMSSTDSDRGRGTERNDDSSAPTGIDLTPTKQKDQGTKVEQPVVDPVSALKDAGTAMSRSLRTSVGLGESTDGSQEQGHQPYGDVYMPRPLHMDRSESALSSVPPTPPAKDTPKSEFPPTPPLKQHSPERLSTPERPIMATQLSVDPSNDDQESDRLRKEIVASLSPLRMSTVPSTEPDHNSLRPESKDADRASSILDSYYAELEKNSPRTSNDLNRDIPELAPLKATSSAHSGTPQKPAALNRFSWEANSPHLMTPEKQPQGATVAEPTKTADTDKIPSPTTERAVGSEQQQWNEGIPEDPYFGPGHTFTVTKPEPMTEADLAARSPTPPLDTGASLTSPPTREQTRSPGLHIVNSAQDPEAVDLPPRWSAEHSNQQPGIEKEPSPQTELKEQNPAVSADAALTGSIEAPESSAVHEPEIKSPTSPKSPTDKPLGAREIATIGSTAERIATYNRTREQWANTDHGLSSWITATFEADPTLATPSAQTPSQAARPQSGVFRHKHTGSLALLGKFTGSSNSPSSGTHYEQYNSAGGQVPASASSPTAGPSKTSSGFLGRTGSHSIQTQQMQAKGKDLLHTAGVLSGKGMTSAKGLFAKGKSRFNRDKDSAKSREAPSEPEPVSVSTANANPVPRSCATADISDVEPKRRRRFSSPFRRSRSRPRSASAVLSSTTSLQSSTSLSAPSTDVPDIPKAFQDRPHSYHAPDLCMHPAYRGSADQLSLTSPSYEQSRTWMLSSSVRSGFVTETEVPDDDAIPPVPPIPAGINNETRGRRSRSWANASLMMHSTIQHSASPSKGSRSVGASPVVAQFDRRGEARASKSRASGLDAYPQVPWLVEEGERNKTHRATHSLPVTKGLWMGDISPTLTKRTPTKADDEQNDRSRQLVQLQDTSVTQASSSHVKPSEQHVGIGGFQAGDEPHQKLLESKSRPQPDNAAEFAHSPWPGTLITNTKSIVNDNDRGEGSDEAPVPRAFVMHLANESPLPQSAIASLHEVSDDDSSTTSFAKFHNTNDQIELRPKIESKVFDTDNGSEAKGYLPHANVQPGPRMSGASEEDDAQRSGAVQLVNSVTTAHEYMALLKTSSPGGSSSHTVTKERQASYETRTIGIGDVSPTSDHADTPSLGKDSARALDMQSALESKVVGAGDVSPVSTRSFNSSTERLPRTFDDEELAQGLARPKVDRFYTADMRLDAEPPEYKTLHLDGKDVTEDRPRIERFETAQEGVQGSSELMIPKIRQPASRFATLMSSEPVVSYKEYTGSSSSSDDIEVLESTPEKQAHYAHGHGSNTLALPAERADGSMPTATRRVSASQLQVVHAVEEYAASDSSLASWDHDSNAADAIHEPDAADAMRDDSNLVTPVAQAPSNAAQHGQQADQATNSNNNPSYAAVNGYFQDQSTTAPVQEALQHPGSASNMTVPERSKSLLSIISSAVSSVPISPASSNAGRSTPSTIHRMQRDFSNARKTNLADVKIPEEPASAKDDQTPTARNEDYDLYADHNGVVKDVHDDQGQPLRIASTPSAAPADLARTTTGASSIGTVPDVHDSPGRRYSFDRPMSFVSGPHDDDGRPQDQINQPVTGTVAAPPPRSARRSQQYPRAPSGAIYSNFEPVQDTHWPPGEVTSQPTQSAQAPVHEPVSARVARQPTRFVPHSQESDEDDRESSAQLASGPPPQRTPPSIPTETLVAGGQPPQVDRHVGSMQDTHAVQNAQVQPRSVSAPLQQMLSAGNDHRVVSQPLGSPPAAPRNEFEYQQQMMQLQAKYPRFRGAENQAFVQQPGPVQQAIQVQEKPSSKPRLAAALKGIVGRTSPNAPPVSNASPPPSSLAPNAPPSDANRAESFVSAVSSLSREPNTSVSGAPSAVAVGPQRPPSLGADSQYSHVSHGSTQVQPAQSRQDLTTPAIPAQYQSQHPHQQPRQQSQLALPQQSGHSHGYRASTGTIPDGGKKKRFSAITGFFGKSNPAAELQGKFKLSREEKKAQKAQRHTSQPSLQSQLAQQWPPPNTHFVGPQQPTDTLTHGPTFSQVAHSANPRFLPNQAVLQPHGVPAGHAQQGLTHPYPQPQMQQQAQQVATPQQQSLSGEASAYLRTKQLAEEYQARQGAGQPPRPVYENPAAIGAGQRQSIHKSPPSNGYYYPEKPSPEPGAYGSSLEEQQRALHLRQQQQVEAERRLNANLPRSSGEQGAYSASVASRQQAQQHPRIPSEPGAYGASQNARQQALQQQQRSQGLGQEPHGLTPDDRQRTQYGQIPLPGPEAFGRSQIHYDQIQHQTPPQRTSVPPQERQQLPLQQQQPGMTREDHIRHAEEELARHRWQQQQTQLRQFHLQQQAQLAQQSVANRSVSGPLLSQASPPASPLAQRHVSSPEPQYDTPPIPGAYGYVQGVFVSPRDEPHAYTTPHIQPGRQPSDAQMQPISPQVSAQSQMPHNTRQHSDASSVSVISPVSGPSPEPAETGNTVDQRPQKPRMPSISEVHQQPPPEERPWHMNFPAGTTEQDIVRARQKQFLQQQFASQQQAQAERHAASPSPRGSPDKPSPPFTAPLPQSHEQGGGFREVLPRKSPQPYAAPHSAPLDRRSPPHAPSHPQVTSNWPLHTSTDQRTGAQFMADADPSVQQPRTPIHNTGDIDHRRSYVHESQQPAYDDRRYEPTPQDEDQKIPPVSQETQYDDDVPDEAPPSYDGPGVPHEGMEKSNPERPRPPNIITATDDRGRQQDGRPRQASVGLMQHPQPASMAASPQRTVPDMGAESLRRQMLQQEEHARMERIQRSQMQAAQRRREHQEREAARARALELERGVSGGGRVGSLRSVSGSRNGGTPGWERRGLQGSNNRPVFELPAVEDDEPVMRATSFPGQEWVPPMYVDD